MSLTLKLTALTGLCLALIVTSACMSPKMDKNERNEICKDIEIDCHAILGKPMSEGMQQPFCAFKCYDGSWRNTSTGTSTSTGTGTDTGTGTATATNTVTNTTTVTTTATSTNFN